MKNNISLLNNLNSKKLNNILNTNNFNQQANNNNGNYIENLGKEKEAHINNSLESSLYIDSYEKNFSILKSKIKEQEKDIFYLKNRLKNYDITLKEMINLSIELNSLNEIIKNKNKIIKEFRDISASSKQKIEELLKNNKNLLKNIKELKEENFKLNKICDIKNLNSNNFINIYDNKLNEELKELKIENENLKQKLNEKNKEIINLKKLINNLKNKNTSNTNHKKTIDLTYNNTKERNNINYTYSNNAIKANRMTKDRHIKHIKNFKKPKNLSLVNRKILFEERYNPTSINKNKVSIYKQKTQESNSLMNNNYFTSTEPRFYNLNSIDNSRKISNNSHNYSYSDKNYGLESLIYSNYLLDSLKKSICNDYIK